MYFRRRGASSKEIRFLSPSSTDAALYLIRTLLRSRTSYNAFPVSFRATYRPQLEVKKILQCLLLNDGYACDVAAIALHQGKNTLPTIDI
jgi:hypothetical protein